ncbi:hypothetical protein BJY52DRAFT_821201 [Lactarius psammicola]|nr:hypothetical protein BJY52DRAFT_821201 [Lactarius psammicola]
MRLSRALRAVCAQQGRDGIMNALATLEHGVLCSGNVEYDVSYFIPGIGVLLVVIGTMIGAQGDKDREVGYTMNFVLQPGDQEDRESGQDAEQWPLVAVMHQIVLREGS